MILLIDNFDSFAHNLARYLRQLGIAVAVVRNNQLSLSELASKPPRAIVMSPGPCRPENAGICMEVVNRFHQKIPMLGVCLGHQVICQAFGAVIERCPPVHGMSSHVYHQKSPLFEEVEPPFVAGRYHSLAARRDSISTPLKIIAELKSGLVMGVAHESLPIYGIQFHPESVLTPRGYRIVANFLQLSGVTLDSSRAEQLGERLYKEIAVATSLRPENDIRPHCL